MILQLQPELKLVNVYNCFRQFTFCMYRKMKNYLRYMKLNNTLIHFSGTFYTRILTFNIALRRLKPLFALL